MLEASNKHVEQWEMEHLHYFEAESKEYPFSH